MTAMKIASRQALQAPFLVGERVVLRALTEADCDGPYADWFNDAEVCRYNSHHVFPHRVEDVRSYVARVAESKTALVLAIIAKSDKRHIGNIALQEIDWVSRSAALAIIIGETDCWGKGYATEACRLLLTHGFKTLNLHRISCSTSEQNVPMQRLATSLGMTLEGRRRQALFKDGQFVDMVEYGLLRSEFAPS